MADTAPGPPVPGVDTNPASAAWEAVAHYTGGSAAGASGAAPVPNAAAADPFAAPAVADAPPAYGAEVPPPATGPNPAAHTLPPAALPDAVPAPAPLRDAVPPVNTVGAPARSTGHFATPPPGPYPTAGRTARTPGPAGNAAGVPMPYATGVFGPPPAPQAAPVAPVAPPQPVPGQNPGAPGARPVVRGPRMSHVALPAPESVPTVDPRLTQALGRPQHGESLTRRTTRSLRRLAASDGQVTEFATELQQPVTTGRVIAVTSIRGGGGKTTVAALLGRTFNHHRHDPVLTMEADAALGTLAVRMGADSVRWSCTDLAQFISPAMQLMDVTGYLVPVTDGGWLLPASQGRVGAPLDVRTYRKVTLALRRYFAVTVVDCETLPGDVARTAMDTAHARVVVAPMTAEGVNGTRVVLDWLARLPHSALATTVVALTGLAPDMTLDARTATAHLREIGVPVVSLPYDRHLAQGGPIHTEMLGQTTRDATVRLAAEAMRRAIRMR